MKSYSVASKSNDLENTDENDINKDTNDIDEDVVEKHKKEKSNFFKKKKSITQESDYYKDEFDEIALDNDDIDESNNTDIKDSAGHVVGIDKPMWQPKHNDKDLYSDDDVSLWHTSPSRMSTGEWLLTLLLLFIPIINIILLLYWSFFSDSVQEEKKNYCRANIILVAIALIFLLVFGTLGATLLKKSQGLPSTISNLTKHSLQTELHDGVGEYSDLNNPGATAKPKTKNTNKTPQ